MRCDIRAKVRAQREVSGNGFSEVTNCLLVVQDVKVIL